MKLVITEKQKVAATLSGVLGCTKKSTRFNKGLIGYYATPDEGWIVTWATGHMFGLDMPNDYDPKMKSWDLSLLPFIPEKWKVHILPDPHPREQFKEVVALLKREDLTDVFIATDADREGELIGRELLREARAPKTAKYHRVWCTVQNEKGLKKAFDNVTPLIEYRDLGVAADCRQKLDWIVGINMTRAYTSYSHSKQSVGRVVSPTLNLIVERQKEIDSFVPEDYATIQVPVSKDGDTFSMDARFDDIPYAERFAKELKGKDAVITSVENTTEKSSRKLYNTTGLQIDAAAKFGYDADVTMKIMQELYDNGHLTYPRTKAESINEDQIDETKELPALAWDKVFGRPSQCSPGDFDIQRIVEKKKKGAEEASHTGLCPTDTGIEAYQSMIRGNEKQRNIFLLVTARLLCSVLPPRVVDKTKVEALIDNETFRATGSVEREAGWADLERYVNAALKTKAKKKRADTQELPNINEGDVFVCGTGKCTKKQTKPPKQYGQPELLSAMENISRVLTDKKMKEALKDAGLGTPSSRDTIIKNIKDGGFVEVVKGRFYPTDKAKELMALLPDEIKSPVMTGSMELKLDAIARGDGGADELMREIDEWIAKEVAAVKALPPIPDTERYKNNKVFVKGACPHCGADIVETDRSMVCQSNCGFIVWRSVAKKKLPKTELKHLLEHGYSSTKLEGFKGKKGEFSCWLYIDGNEEVKFDFSDDGRDAKTKNIMTLRGEQ